MTLRARMQARLYAQMWNHVVEGICERFNINDLASCFVDVCQLTRAGVRAVVNFGLKVSYLSPKTSSQWRNYGNKYDNDDKSSQKYFRLRQI